MSLIPNVGATPPLPAVGYSTGGENRQASSAPALRGARGGSSQGAERPSAVVPGNALGGKPSTAAAGAVAQDKIELGSSRQLAAKSGLLEGSFEPFIDIIDPRYQTRIARVFGSQAIDAAPETASRAVSKAYEAADSGAKTAFAKDA